MFYKIRDFIRKHFIGYRPSDMLCLKEKDKKIENIKVKSNFTRNQKKIARKINEIIDYINKEG